MISQDPHPVGTTLFGAICQRGHIIDHHLHRPGQDLGFCEQCGEAVLGECEHCGRPIPGDHFGVFPYLANAYRRPSYCRQCGKAFSWTEYALEQLNEVIDEDKDISADQKATLKKDLKELTLEDPSPNAIRRSTTFVKKLMNDPSTRQIVVNVITDAAKKLMSGGG